MAVYGDNYDFGDSPLYKDDGTHASFWVSNVPSNWNNALNWSNTSGGPGGDGVPDYASVVTYDQSGIGNCLIDIPIFPYSFYVTHGYDSTITQNNNTVQAGYGLFDGGNFVGSPTSTVRLTTLYLGDCFLQDSSVHITQDMSCVSSHNQWSPLNNSNIIMDGTGKQNVYVEIGGVVPYLTIKKADTAQVRCYGGHLILIKDNLLIQDGTFNMNGHDIQVGM
jgi:hypothetical protein